MKKILTIISLIVVLVVTYRVAVNNHTVQDRLLERAVTSMLPEPFLDDKDSLKAIVCGSRSPIFDVNRAETCIYIEAGDDIYLFDSGNDSTSNLQDWGIPWANLKGVFYTHLHSDHIAELADVHLQSWIVGGRKEKLKVYGPKGVDLLTAGIEMAYSQDYIFRNKHHGESIASSDAAGFDTKVITENNKVVIDENGLKITSFEVLHYPVEPSLAFKIEYKGRSIIISGDTIFSDDLLRQSMNVDVLFHEVMNIGLLESMRKGAKAVGNDVIDTVLFDVQDYHISVLEVVDIAKRANVGHLIFYHALPAPRNQIMEKIFYRDIDKDFQNWTASIDGTTVTLPVGSDEIILSLTE